MASQSTSTPQSPLDLRPSPPPSPTTRKRGKGWDLSEDEQLCKSWLAVSQDPVIGSDQKNQTFWKRVHEDFIMRHLSSEERTQQGLQSRWSHIQRQVNHFCACFAKVEARGESGKTFEDKVSKTTHRLREFIHISPKSSSSQGAHGPVVAHD